MAWKKDSDILEEIFSEKRFVVTHDFDFGKLVINEGKRCYGIVYLRIKNLKAQNVIKVLDQLLLLDMELKVGSPFLRERLRRLGRRGIAPYPPGDHRC
jgi:predicted nuclease of predicted toxin-antitoxin system